MSASRVRRAHRSQCPLGRVGGMFPSDFIDKGTPSQQGALAVGLELGGGCGRHRAGQQV